MSCLCYLCLFAQSGIQYTLCCVFALFFFVLCTLYMLPVSLDCTFLISPSVFFTICVFSSSFNVDVHLMFDSSLCFSLSTNC